MASRGRDAQLAIGAVARIGFATAQVDGVRRERLLDEVAVVAVAKSHALARADEVRLGDLEHETFARVDEQDGAGYNAAVRDRCAPRAPSPGRSTARPARWHGRPRCAGAAASA